MAHNVCDRVLQKQDPVLHTVKIPVKLYIIVFVFGYITYHITVDLWSVLSVSALLVMIVSPFFRYFNIRRIIGFAVVFALGVLWGVIPEQIIRVTLIWMVLNITEVQLLIQPLKRAEKEFRSDAD